MGNCLSVRPKAGPKRNHVSDVGLPTYASATDTPEPPAILPSTTSPATTFYDTLPSTATPSTASPSTTSPPTTLPSTKPPRTPSDAPSTPAKTKSKLSLTTMLSPTNAAKTKTKQSLSTRLSPTTPQYTVFISHADEDRATIAVPLREALGSLGITAFVDKAGTDTKPALIDAMETARVAVMVLSPEFVARRQPMNELMCFLRRREKDSAVGHGAPVVIPFFYRLKMAELYDEPRLDRADKDGKLVYRKTKFYERQKNREPEANIAAIKSALKGIREIIGVSNYVDASNDPSYETRQKREFLLRQLCDMVRQTVRIGTVMKNARRIAGGAKRDAFHSHFDVPYDTSKLVFDFHSKDEDGNASTQEGRVLEMLLGGSSDANRAIAVQGICGVGKTSLLRGIRSLKRVRERFRDGVYNVSFGKDVSHREVIEALSTAVQKSGGNARADAMRGVTDVRKVIDLFRSWFVNTQCLFVIDDIRETKEVPSDTIHELMKLYISGRDSKVLLTTRIAEVASTADTCFSLEPRGALENESRAILVHCSGIELEKCRKDDKKAVHEILEQCRGLPLLLAVAGKAVKALSFRRKHGRCVAYHAYAQSLKKNMQSLPNIEFGSYEWLSARMMISLELLEKRKHDFGVRVNTTVAAMHRRLSALPKLTRIPVSTLKHLWELEDELQAATIAREFEQVGLADVELERSTSGPVELLRLHNSIYEFAMRETRKHREQRLGHETLLRGYSRGLVIKDGSHEWWRTSLGPDGYIHHSLCRHLLAAGRAVELVQLLLNPQWAERQLQVNGILYLKFDFSLGMKAVQDGMVDQAEEEGAETRQALSLILEAATLSSTFIATNFEEFRFQLHGRLKGYSEGFKVIRRYVRWMETDSPKPAVLCLNDFLVQPRGMSTRIISIGSPVHCMATLNDGKRVACGCCDGRIVVVNTLRGKIEKEWKAHNQGVVSIAAGRNGARIVSGHSNGTVKVWESESGRCMATFEGHTRAVKCVEVMADGKRVISGSSDGTIQIWNMGTGRTVVKPIISHAGSVKCVALLGDSEHIVTGGWDKSLRLWNVRNGVQVGDAFYGHAYWVTCVAVTPDRRRIVSGSWDDTVMVWDVGSHNQIGDALKGHTRGVECVTVSGDGRRIISGSEDKKIRVWDTESGEQVCDPLTGHAQTISGVSFLTKVNSIVSCSWDGTVRVWDVPYKKARAALHDDEVTTISFTPDGRYVVSGSLDKTCRIWDTVSGQQVGPLIGHSAPVTGVATTQKRVVSVSQDRTVRVWDMASRNLLHTLTGHTHAINSVAVTPQGDRAVTGSSDKTVRVWDLTASDGRHTILNGHSAMVKNVFLTDDGTRLVSVDGDDHALVWDLAARKLVNRFLIKDGWSLPRATVLRLVAEADLYDDCLIQVRDRDVVYGEDADGIVLATMEANVRCWAVSPNRTILCVGLEDGHVGLMKLLT